MAARISVLVVVSELDPFRQLLASLERQTLPASEFEVLVAGGSLSADAFALLGRLATHRANVQVIEGGDAPWSTLVAGSSGEVVLPLGDTDTVYPRALARLTDEAGMADVVLGKSVRSGARTVAWDLMTADRTLDPADIRPDEAEELAVAMTREVARAAAAGATDVARLRRGAVTQARSARTLATLLCLRSATDPGPLPRGANPADVRAVFVGDELVITGDLGARCSVRSLETGVEWPLDTDPLDGTRLRIDLRTAALGAPLEQGRWVVETTRGSEPPVGVHLVADAPGSALVGETLVVVKGKPGRRLVIDVGATSKNPFRPVDLTAASIVEDASGTRLRLPLPIGYVGGPVVRPATLFLDEFPLTASVAASDSEVALECLLSGVPGSSSLKVAVDGGMAHPLGIQLVIANAGEMSLQRPSAAEDVPEEEATRRTALRRLTDRITR